MPKLYEYELGRATDILTRELFKLKPGETIVITADTESDERVVDATARAAFACGAKPMVVWLAAPLGVGKAADPMLPTESLYGALMGADAWVEYNNQWIFYSNVYDRVMKDNKKLRYSCLVGMNVDMMVRTIGRIDYPALEKFMARITDLTKNANEVRITNPSGMDVTFKNTPEHRGAYSLGYCDTPGAHMMAGQIYWAIDLNTLNGKIVFDGSINPPLRLVKEPVVLHIKNGDIVKFEDGKDAVEYEAWLRGFNDPNMLKIAHICYGFNPGAKLTGDVVEDERVWGAVEWGIGNMDYRPAASHSDGICLNVSVWLDGKQILDKGKSVDKELSKLAKKLGKQ
jgi:leucyl aminopeptidase (aminopeptidase T)